MARVFLIIVAIAVAAGRLDRVIFSLRERRGEKKRGAKLRAV